MNRNYKRAMWAKIINKTCLMSVSDEKWRFGKTGPVQLSIWWSSLPLILIGLLDCWGFEMSSFWVKCPRTEEAFARKSPWGCRPRILFVSRIVFDKISGIVRWYLYLRARSKVISVQPITMQASVEWRWMPLNMWWDCRGQLITDICNLFSLFCLIEVNYLSCIW